ncbi:hypothetical protein NIM87_01095 [Devosia sp. XJ19-1]|uniref:Uncharacterized protein n=1 Tax=Devosia ureilytica TaxID=2952754 RepID=A0A9Q4ALX0_9HYPH|nr:hypothetical protein [Devosia ureilytica]MCP8882092.1 hypothetical protein [Devosia ureilytica]MCP8886022.1 hypothetical protein [Devosia ureilytica]
MSIATVLSQLGIPRHDPHSLEAQLHAMRRDVQRIGKALSRQASHHTEGWNDHLSDFGREAAHHTAHLAEIAGTQAMRGAIMVRHDPLPALAVIGTGLLLARLLSRR